MALTREEALLNSIYSGQPSKVQPITREEQYLAYIAGETNSRPTSPITRKEHYLERIASSGVSGGSSVNVQPLSVTENGTYTAPSGVAYSPVNVNVASSGGDSEAEAFLDRILEAPLSPDTIELYYNDRVEKLRDYAFYGVRNIKKIDLPNVKLTNISSLNNCFGLEELNLPNCETMWNDTCSYCIDLKYVNIPSCKIIYSAAFGNCTGLETVILGADCVLKYTSAFSNSSISNGTGYIYVPDDLVEDYKVATNWVTYASQIKGISELEG